MTNQLSCDNGPLKCVFNMEPTGACLHIMVEILANPEVERSMLRRRRSSPHSFDSNIAAEKARLGAQASQLPHGPEKDRLLRKIRQLDAAAHMHDWLTSPGLMPPSE